MGRYTHILWDWNGTLLDDVDACVSAVNKMMHRRNLGGLRTPRYREIFGFPVKSYYRALGFDLDAEDWDAMAQEFHAAYLSDGTPKLHRDVEEVLEALRASGTSMSILSACEQEILTKMLADFELLPFFEHVRGLSDLYAHSKVELGRELIRELDDDPEELVLIGDTLHDLDVAKELGCDCILVSAGHQSHARLAVSGAPVLSGLAELRRFLGESVAA